MASNIPRRKSAPKWLAGLAAASLALVAAPGAIAASYPHERSAGITLNSIGPGVAYRQFVTPELGFQVGGFYSLISSGGLLGGFSGPLVGGELLYSPFHGDGKRVYLLAGGGVPLRSASSWYSYFWTVGLGGSLQFSPWLTGYLSVPLLYMAIPTPHAGLMVQF